MCTEVGQKKKKCSGGGAGQSGVHDYGFYGSNVSNALDVEVLNAVLRSRRRRRYKRRVDEVDEIMYPNQELIYMPKGL